MNSQPIMVTSNAELNELCKSWNTLEFIGLDTEFMRTNTFYPKMGLIQLCDNKACYLIDPLEMDDWSEFISLLRSDVVVVMHSCSEDLNLLHSALNVLPKRVFDTQMAAAFLNLGYSISYQNLVAEVLDESVSKDATRSDWLQRPLSADQLNYAALDVFYLPRLFEMLSKRLLENKTYEWFASDCANLREIACAVEDESSWRLAYLDISTAWKLDSIQLRYLQKLVYWRELQARRRDKPKSWIARDADLMTIASQLKAPETEPLESQFSRLRDVDSQLLQRNSRSMLALLAESSLELPDVSEHYPMKPLAAAGRSRLKACQSVARDFAQALDIAPELLSRKRHWLELVQITGTRTTPVWPLELEGWRRQLLEEPINKLFAN